MSTKPGIHSKQIPRNSEPHANLPLKSADGKSFVAKNMMPGEYDYQRDLQTPLASCPNLRVLEDGNPELDLFVYSYLETNVLQECRNLNKDTKKNLLKSALTGLAAMHERNIIHTGVYTPYSLPLLPSINLDLFFYPLEFISMELQSLT